MRTFIVGLSLTLIALAASPAQARYHHHHSTRNYSEARYESCNCYFGYMGNGAGLCSPVTSCSSEGGRCRGGCPAQTSND